MVEFLLNTALQNTYQHILSRSQRPLLSIGCRRGLRVKRVHKRLNPRISFLSAGQGPGEKLTILTVAPDWDFPTSLKSVMCCFPGELGGDSRCRSFELVRWNEVLRFLFRVLDSRNLAGDGSCRGGLQSL